MSKMLMQISDEELTKLYRDGCVKPPHSGGIGWEYDDALLETNKVLNRLVVDLISIRSELRRMKEEK